jgi:hypothetical protein
MNKKEVLKHFVKQVQMDLGDLLPPRRHPERNFVVTSNA